MINVRVLQNFPAVAQLQQTDVKFSQPSALETD